MVRSKDTLGERLRATRNEVGFSLREVSARVGINHGYIADIEYDRRVPSERVLKKLSDIQGLDFDELMAMAGRFGKKGDDYIRKHPMMRMIVRQAAEDDLNDD